MTTAMRRMCLLTTVALLAATPASAQLVNENLLVAMPSGYKVDYQNKTKQGVITEMVPTAENVNAWTEMVTVQVFFGLKVPPDEFRARLEKLWGDSCPGSTFKSVATGAENGYPSTTWMQTCPQNKTTGKPEITWMKAIRGNDSFYVVQKAFKFTPSDEQVATWTAYLRGVSVCDSRVQARACPKTK